MKDVTPENSKVFTPQRFRAFGEMVRLKFVGPALRILKNPVHEISHLPEWTFKESLLAVFFVSMAQGVLSAFFENRLVPGLVSGIFMTPIASTLGSISALFFIYYGLQFFENKKVDLTVLFRIVTLSLIPFWILTIPVAVVSPLFLVGFAITCTVLAVGISEHFGVERNRSTKLLFGLWLLGFIFWIWTYVDFEKVQSQFKGSGIPKVELGK